MFKIPRNVGIRNNFYISFWWAWLIGLNRTLIPYKLSGGNPRIVQHSCKRFNLIFFKLHRQLHISRIFIENESSCLGSTHQTPLVLTKRES